MLLPLPTPMLLAQLLLTAQL